jgi:PIN domain nuclease of toxin-antitoxin system
VLLELELLHEIGRIRRSATVVADYLQQTLAISCANDAFAEVVRQALPLAFSRDPFDRLIVAHAACRRAGLITLDQHIHAHYGQSLA